MGGGGTSVSIGMLRLSLDPGSVDLACVWLAGGAANKIQISAAMSTGCFAALKLSENIDPSLDQQEDWRPLNKTGA